MTEIQKLLFKEQEEAYGDFIAGLTPTVPRDHFIGVRVPRIRILAKSLSLNNCKAFLKELPHTYYEENLLHGFIIQRMKDYDEVIKEVNTFLPYIDNWATCDTMSPKCFNKHHNELIKEIKIWLTKKETYTVRFAIVTLMAHFLEADFKKEYLDWLSDIHVDQYYINIAIAWFYATALAKQWNETIKIIEAKKLDKWLHNKAIQKAIESNRISEENKAYLRTLKI